jgi:hypothetical protein
LHPRRNGTSTEGILLGRSPANARRLVVLARGRPEYEEIGLADVTFVLPSFISSTLAIRSLPLDPSHPTVFPLLQSLRKLEIRVERETRALVGKGAKDLYRFFTGGTRVAKTTTAVGALRALGAEAGALSETYLAMHRLLISDPVHFVADPVDLRTTGMFFLRPLQEIKLFEKVRGWVRERSDQVMAFAKKAATVRHWGVENPPVFEEGAASVRTRPVEGVRWSQDDLAILAFLRHSLENERAIQQQPYMAISPSILKLVDAATREMGGTPFEEGLDFGRQRIMGFLAEVGVVAPWEDWVVHEAKGLLERWDDVNAKLLRPAASSLSPTLDANPKPDAPPSDPLAPSSPSSRTPIADPYSFDAHDSVREDFGQLAVYTIDDPGAMELDDGISISPASPSTTGAPTWWIHVHVADPTALLQPSHILSQVAKLRDHTEYFPERTWAMLPEAFVIDEGMSLGSQGGGEQKTLSFSMRIDESGEVLESGVKAGIVRNVMRLTYAAVNEVLGYGEPEASALLTYPVVPPDYEIPSSRSKARDTDDSLLATDTVASTNLRILHHLASAMLQRRANTSALYWTFPSAGVSVSPTLSHHFAAPTKPHFYVNSPLISLRLPATGPSISPAQLLVSEMMVAANRAAAKFSVERNLPVPFRSQAAPVADPSSLQSILALRNPFTGEARGEDVLRHRIDFLPGTTGVEPGIHWPMGINDEYGYVKVTSPLRRYADMFSHWQIKSALLPSGSPGSTAPFTRSAVLSHIQGFDQAHKSRGRLSKHAEAFWAMYLLEKKLAPAARAADPLARELMENLTAMALRRPAFSSFDGTWVQPVLIPELGVRATLVSEREAEAPEPGESEAVRIAEISVSARSRMVVERK